jgi:TolC family type I secretion outer membrane protein
MHFSRFLTAVLLISTACATAVMADPKSDLFDPDVFGTRASLQHRLPGLIDPTTRHCDLEARPLLLRDAVDLALCRNPSTRAAWAAAQLQAAVLGSADSAYLPTISASGSYTRTYGGTHADVTGELLSESQNSRDAALLLSWTLYDFGGREARLSSARHALDASAATLNSVSQQVAAETVQAYYNVVAADASQASAMTTESTASHSLEVARALRGGGVATLADVLQAETAYHQAVLVRVQSTAAAMTARGSLAVVIGWPADQGLKLQAAAIPAEIPALTVRIADLMAEAARQRPDLAAAQAEREAAAADVTVARAVGRPSISFQAGRNLADTSGIPSENYNQIGLYVTVPLFSGFNVAYGVRQAQATLAAREASAEQVRLTVSLDVWNAYYALDSANQQLAATAELSRAAEDNQQVALGRYQSGVGTIIDVLTAQTGAANARQLRINAELAWQVSRAQLALALGRLSGAEPLDNMQVVP